MPVETFLELVDELEVRGMFGDRDAVYRFLVMHPERTEWVVAEFAIWGCDQLRRNGQYEEALEGLDARKWQVDSWPVRVQGRYWQALGQVYFNLPGRIEDAFAVQRELLTMPGFDELPLNRQMLARESFLASKAKAGQIVDDEYRKIALEYCNFLYMYRKSLQRFKMWDRGLAGFVAALGEGERAQEHWLAAAFFTTREYSLNH
ncbi:MAG: hypothetical protein AB1352_04225 [Patescibacteria group bacterium]